MIILTSDNNVDAFIKSENFNNRQSNGDASGVGAVIPKIAANTCMNSNDEL